MNKKIIIGIIEFLVIVLIGSGAFIFIDSNKEKSSKFSDNSLNKTKSEEIKKSISNKINKKSFSCLLFIFWKYKKYGRRNI